MSVNDIITTLHDFLRHWLTDEDFRDKYDDNVEVALKDCGFEDVDPDDLMDALPLVAEDLTLVQQRNVYDYLETVSEVDGGSKFNVDQGGGSKSTSDGGGDSGAQGNAAATTAAVAHDESMEEVVRHIYNIQNLTEHNTSYIDDRDVLNTLTNVGEGDLTLEQVIAGDGAVVAGDDAEGVNTGENNGFIAGDDIEDIEWNDVDGNDNIVDSQVIDSNLVRGDGNTTTGDIGGPATIVSGDDNILAEDSNVVGGDFDGVFVGDDANGANFGTAYDVDANESAVNFGSGNAVVDESQHAKDSFNTDNSIDDSFNTDNSKHAKDSFNTDVDVKESFNSDDDGIDADIDDITLDHSTKVKESFNSDDDGIDADLDDVEIDASDDDEITKEYDTDVDIEKSFNEDNDGLDADLDDIVIDASDDDKLDIDAEIDLPVA